MIFISHFLFTFSMFVCRVLHPKCFSFLFSLILLIIDLNTLDLSLSICLFICFFLNNFLFHQWFRFLYHSVLKLFPEYLWSLSFFMFVSLISLFNYVLLFILLPEYSLFSLCVCFFLYIFLTSIISFSVSFRTFIYFFLSLFTLNISLFVLFFLFLYISRSLFILFSPSFCSYVVLFLENPCYLLLSLFVCLFICLFVCLFVAVYLSLLFSLPCRIPHRMLMSASRVDIVLNVQVRWPYRQGRWRNTGIPPWGWRGYTGVTSSHSTLAQWLPVALQGGSGRGSPGGSVGQAGFWGGLLCEVVRDLVVQVIGIFVAVLRG